MLRQGFAVDSCDYDGRTALMLAASKGNEDVIHSLLAAGCDPQVSFTTFGLAHSGPWSPVYEMWVLQ